MRPPELVRNVGGDPAGAQQTSKPLALVVAGMHRSGTSAVTRALALCGLSLPRTLIPANAFNEDGHWESDIVRAGNDDLLAQLDSAWDDALFLRSMRRARMPRESVETIKAAVGDQFDADRDVVIKDPRIALLLPAWRQALNELGYDQRLIIPVRHPLEVAASLTRRNGFPPVKSALLWLTHLLSVERDSRNMSRVFVLYDDLLTDWRSSLRRVERVLGVRLPRWNDTAEAEIDAFLSTNKRHHRLDADALIARDDIPVWVADAYEWAVAASKGNDEPPPAVLTKIAEEFGTAADIYAPLLSFERKRADRSTGWAPETATAQSFEVSVYSATASADFDEVTRAYGMMELIGAPRVFSVSTPARGEAITKLRVDPADTPGVLLLHALRLRAPDGAVVWEWQGLPNLFESALGLIAQRRSASSTLLEFTDSDPQLHIPATAFSAEHKQLTIEIVASALGEAELRQWRLEHAASELERAIERQRELQEAGQLQLGAIERIDGRLADAHQQQAASFAALDQKLDARAQQLDAQAQASNAHAIQLEAQVQQANDLLVEAIRVSTEGATRTEEQSAELVATRESMAALSEAIAATEASSAARTAESAAFLERRLSALADDFTLQSRAAAQAYEAKFLDVQQTLSGQARASGDALRTELATMRETMTRELAASRETNEAIRRDLSETVASLSTHLANVTHQKDHALATAQSYGQTIEAMRASTSWRLTAPVRALRGGPRGLLGGAKQFARRARAALRRRLDGKSYAAEIAEADPEHGLHARLLAKSSLFDPDWYLSTYQDVRMAGIEPLHHYLHHGGFEGRSPGPAFDSRWYLAQNPDVAAVGINPLVHYIAAGKRENRAPMPGLEGQANPTLGQSMRLLGKVQHWKYLVANGGLKFDALLPRKLARRLRASAAFNRPKIEVVVKSERGSAAHVTAFQQMFETATAKGAEYVPLAPDSIATPSRIRAICFYLPQFHPIPENDAWWGKGFTEWTNVSKATPQFVGHYQPRLPDELGFYDLRVPDVQRRQVELAKQYGLHGFCFHYYWFTGRKRLLERPLNQFLAATDLNFPFCICWANENWTRRWDGLDQEILMEQRHEPQDDREFIEDLAPVLRDPRYIKVNGRPLIIVYRVDILPDAARTANVWREYCRANGLGEPFLVAAQTFGIKDPRPYGFDAAVEFPPHADYSPQEVTRELSFINPNAEGRVYSYEKVAKREARFEFPDYKVFKGIIPAWDNEARKPGKGHAFAGATPTLYRSWLTSLLRATDRQYQSPDEKLVFINAWNEWAEGAYLEPDRRFGYAYLQATRTALAAFPDRAGAMAASPQATPPLYVFVHAFYTDVLEEILGDLALVQTPARLVVTCPPERAESVREAILSAGLDCPFDVIETENRGRDVLAFLEAMKRVSVPADAIILKLHTKKSTHREDGAHWRREMFDELLASETVESALHAFASDSSLGLVAPAKHLAPITTYIGFNQERIETLLKRGGWKSIDTQTDVFAAGTMFFVRRKSFDSILALNVTRDEFEAEAGQKDGTMAHALERMFGLVILREGGRIIDTDMLLNGAASASGEDFAFAVKTDYLYRRSDQ